MELNWLRYFYEVARFQNVTRASETLRVSQPAVSKTIRLLEGQLGYKLFVKSGRNIRLSSEGERLYEHCIPLFKRVEQIRHLGREVGASWRGTLRVGASDNVANYLFPEVIHVFHQQVPQAEWFLYAGSSKEIKQRLLSGEVDFGVFYTELSLAELQLLREETLGAVSFVAVCSRRFGARINVKQLRALRLPYVGVRFADYANTLPEQWIVKALGIPHSKTVQTNSKETQKRIVQAGLGFGIFPKFMVEQEIRDGELTLIRGSERPMSLRLVYRSDETLTPAVHKFIGLLKERLFA